jgi:hypothetical protein
MKTLIPNIWVFDLIIQQQSHWCNNNETFVRYHKKKRLQWCEASVWQFAPVHSTGTLMMMTTTTMTVLWHLIRSNSWFYSSHCITMTIKKFIHYNCLSFLLEAYGRKRWTQFMSMSTPAIKLFYILMTVRSCKHQSMKISLYVFWHFVHIHERQFDL